MKRTLSITVVIAMIFTAVGLGAESTAPFVEPAQGFPGGTFTINDPQGRMRQGDLAVFYPDGSEPSFGNAAKDVTVSSDGRTLTGKVPNIVLPGLQHFISVRPTVAEGPRFNDLSFYVRGQHLY